jgi:hypothetical protein
LADSVEKEIADYLVTKGLGTFGVDIFDDKLPTDPDSAILIRPSGGSGPTFGFGTPGVKTDNPTIQVKVRGLPYDPASGQAKAFSAYYEIAKIQAQTLGTSFYYTSNPLQPPFQLERDANERFIWAFNVLFEKEPAA